MENGGSGRIESPRSVSKTAAIVISVMVGAAVLLYVLVEARTAFAYIAVAAFLAGALNHTVEWLCHRGFRRGLAIAAIISALVGLLLGVMLLLIPTAARQGKQLIQNAPEILKDVRESGFYKRIDNQFDLSAQIQRLETELPKTLEKGLDPAIKALTSVFNVAAGSITIFFLTIFMLVFGGALVRAALHEATPARRVRYRRVLDKVYNSVGGYLAGISFVCLVNGTLTGIVLATLRVPFFLPLALMSGLSSLVPYAGPVVMGTTVTLITLATVGLWKAVIVGAYYILYGQLEGNVLAPLVFKRTVHVNPLVSIMSLVIFGELAGVTGAIAAVPLAAMGQVVVREILLLRREKLRLPLTGEAGSVEELPQREIKKLAAEDAAHKHAERSEG